MFILSRESLGMRLHRAGPEIKDGGRHRAEIGGHVYSTQLAVDIVHCIAGGGGLGACSPQENFEI